MSARKAKLSTSSLLWYASSVLEELKHYVPNSRMSLDYAWLSDCSGKNSHVFNVIFLLGYSSENQGR